MNTTTKKKRNGEKQEENGHEYFIPNKNKAAEAGDDSNINT